MNSDNGYGFLAKGTASFVSIRANHVYGNVSNGGISVGYGSVVPVIPHDHEICWNRVVFTEDSTNGKTLIFANQNSRQGQPYNSYIYRNTFVNGSAWVRFKGKENYKVDGNVVVSKDLDKWNENIMDTNMINLTGSRKDFITDNQGRLTGFALDYKGRVGFQLD